MKKRLIGSWLVAAMATATFGATAAQAQDEVSQEPKIGSPLSPILSAAIQVTREVAATTDPVTAVLGDDATAAPAELGEFHVAARTFQVGADEWSSIDLAPEGVSDDAIRNFSPGTRDFYEVATGVTLVAAETPDWISNSERIFEELTVLRTNEAAAAALPRPGFTSDPLTGAFDGAAHSANSGTITPSYLRTDETGFVQTFELAHEILELSYDDRFFTVFVLEASAVPIDMLYAMAGIDEMPYYVRTSLGVVNPEPGTLADVQLENVPLEWLPAVEDTPPEDTPAEDTPAEDTPAEDTPAESPPLEEQVTEAVDSSDDGGVSLLIVLLLLGLLGLAAYTYWYMRRGKGCWLVNMFRSDDVAAPLLPTEEAAPTYPTVEGWEQLPPDVGLAAQKNAGWAADWRPPVGVDLDTIRAAPDEYVFYRLGDKIIVGSADSPRAHTEYWPPEWNETSGGIGGAGVN